MHALIAPPSDHWHDVLVGSLLGLVLSYFSYRQYFPSLADPRAHLPYSPRIKREHDETLPLYHGRQSSSLNRTDHEDQLERTVERPGPGHITDSWTDEEGQNNPRRRSDEEINSSLLVGI